MHEKSSEKISPDQMDFLMNNLDERGKPEGDAPRKTEEDVAAKAKKPRKVVHKPRIPEHVPIESRQVIEPQEVLEQPDRWRRIGEEVSEYLDYQPGYFFKRQIVRPKYVCICKPDQAPIIAALPNRWTERSIAATGLLAHITTRKYIDHLPLYRQEQIFRTRHGVEIPRNTMARWMENVADSLKLIYLCMAEQLFSGDYLQVDETPIKYLQPGSGKAQQGYFWAYSNPKGDVLFDWQTGRSHQCLLEMLAKPNPEKKGEALIFIFQGLLQCDGYSAYKTLANKSTGIDLVGCWAHVRRKFKEAAPDFPRQAGWILRQIQHLYAIERKLREKKASPRLRATKRASESRPILARIKKVLELYKARASILPESSLGKAIAYALGEWKGLDLYIESGHIEIDNNLIENAIRPTAVGKKNWMFVGRAETGERSAIIYSVLESCRRRGIDPYKYLADVLERLPNSTTAEIAKLTPAGWAAERRSEIAQAA